MQAFTRRPGFFIDNRPAMVYNGSGFLSHFSPPAQSAAFPGQIGGFPLIRLICVDMDDTLLTPQHGIHPDDRAAIAAATEAGAFVVPCSGRMALSLAPYARDLGLRYLAACNGAHVVDLDGYRTLHRAGIPPKDVADVARWAKERGLYLQAYYGDIYEYEADCSYSEGYRISSGVTGRAVGPLWACARESEKLLFIGDPDELTLRLAELRQAFPGLLFAKSKPHFVEVMSPSAGKDEALRFLAGYLGVDMRDTMAIGDSENDLPMLSAAGVAVSMGNGSQACKAAAAYVTADNSSGGVSRALRRYVLEAQR